MAQLCGGGGGVAAAEQCYVVLLERHDNRDRGTHVRARTNTHHSLTYLPLSRADSDSLKGQLILKMSFWCHRFDQKKTQNFLKDFI